MIIIFSRRKASHQDDEQRHFNADHHFEVVVKNSNLRRRASPVVADSWVDSDVDACFPTIFPLIDLFNSKVEMFRNIQQTDAVVASDDEISDVLGPLASSLNVCHQMDIEEVQN